MPTIVVDCGCSGGFQRGDWYSNPRSRRGSTWWYSHYQPRPVQSKNFQNVPWEFPASSIFKLQPQLTTISRLPTTVPSTKSRELITDDFSVLRLDYNTALLCKNAVTTNMICVQNACYSQWPRWQKIEISKTSILLSSVWILTGWFINEDKNTQKENVTNVLKIWKIYFETPNNLFIM